MIGSLQRQKRRYVVPYFDHRYIQNRSILFTKISLIFISLFFLLCLYSVIFKQFPILIANIAASVHELDCGSRGNFAETSGSLLLIWSCPSPIIVPVSKQLIIRLSSQNLPSRLHPNHPNRSFLRIYSSVSNFLSDCPSPVENYSSHGSICNDPSMTQIGKMMVFCHFSREEVTRRYDRSSLMRHFCKLILFTI